MGGGKAWEASLSFIQHLLIELECWASCQAWGDGWKRWAFFLPSRSSGSGGARGEGIDGKQQINKINLLKLTKQLREEGARAGGGGYLLEAGGQRGPHCDLKLELACKYRVWGQGAEGTVRANVEEEPDPKGLECWVQSELLLR